MHNAQLFRSLTRKPRDWFFVLIVSPMLFLAAGCGSALNIEAPRESYIPSSLAPSMSELPLDAEIDVRAMENLINTKFTGLLYEGKNINDKNISVKVWKADNFSVFVNNNEITYRVPLKIWANLAWKVEKFGFSVSDEYEATGTIALVYKTKIEIDNNWKVVSKTTSSGYNWIETPKFNVAGFTIPVKPIADFALSRTEKMITEQIDKLLSESVDLKAELSKTWTDIQKPFIINPDYNLWLRVTPKEVLLSPFTTKGAKLHIPVAFNAQIETFMGAEPPQNVPSPLPALKIIERQPKEFSLNVAADITYDQISKVAKEQLSGFTFNEGGKSITIKDIQVYSSNGKAVFILDVLGSLKGKIYFSGNMRYNPDSTSIEITEPEFDIKTRSALVKSANWLLHGVILKKIAPYLSYKVAEDLENARLEANKMMTKYSLLEGIDLEGSLSAITVTNLNMVPGAVRLQVNLKGNVGIKVNTIKM